MTRKIIALDVMGGDHGPTVVIPAALQSLKQYADIELLLVGDQQIIAAELAKHNAQANERIKVHHASEQIFNEDPPAVVLRTKKDSSMRVAINLVKEGVAGAVVSAGNTGALMVLARFILKTLPGIDRPAIIHKIPTRKGNIQMLDLGANVDCAPEHLLQFAVMGSIYTQAVDNKPQPKVCLLNIGSEAIKGSEVVKKASALIEQSHAVNYQGYIEGNDIFMGHADVVVCDGFVGNITLKTSEGVTKFIFSAFKQAFNKNIFTKLMALCAYPIFRLLAKQFDLNSLNGASFLGIRGNVIKSHGSAGVLAFANAIAEARLEIENNVPEKIMLEVEKHLVSSDPN